MRRLLFALCMFISFNSAAKFTLEEIAQASQYRDADISPDGKHLAVVYIKDGKRNLAVLSMKDFSVVGGANLGQDAEIGTVYWANEERLVMSLLRTEDDQAESMSHGEIYALNYDGSDGKIIFGYTKARKGGIKARQTDLDMAGGRVINLLPDERDNILVASQPFSQNAGSLAEVFKLNVYTGKQSPRVIRAPTKLASIYTDKVGNVLMASGVDENGDSQIFRKAKNSNDWEEVSSQYGTEFGIVGLSEDGKKAIFFDNYQQDKIGLFSLDLDTFERKSIYTDPVVDLSSVSLTADNTAVYAVRVESGYPSYVVFGDAGEEAKLFKSLLQALPGYRLNITSSTDDNRKWIIHASSDIDAGTWYMFDAEKNSLTQLLANMSHIAVDDLSEMQPVNFTARDGEKIPAYVTYPVGMKKDEKVPLVTLVHGGPHGPRDVWAFYREVQMLAGQGYAVLQVNFRGSGGYGSAYMESGYQHWGDLIMHDIIDGTKWLVDQGTIDADNICIMGASFGGYSAVMAAELAPDLFKCSVATAGVYDMNLMFTEGDTTDVFYGKDLLEKYLGTDRDQRIKFSPNYHVDKLKGPVLIAHGEKDRRAPFEHAVRLKNAMDKAGKPYRWFVKEDETHGFYDDKNRAEYFSVVASFLAENLK